MKKLLLTLSLLISAITFAQSWTSQATGFNNPSRGIDEIHIVDANTILFIKILKSSIINKLLKTTAPLIGLHMLSTKANPKICTPNQVTFFIIVG